MTSETSPRVAMVMLESIHRFVSDQRGADDPAVLRLEALMRRTQAQAVLDPASIDWDRCLDGLIVRLPPVEAVHEPFSDEEI
jgi:hypothetical protein